MKSVRVGAFVAAAAFVLVLLAALSGGSPAVAAVTADPSPTASPTPCTVLNGCLTPSPTPQPPSPTPQPPSPTPSATPSPTPSRTKAPVATYSPKPRSTYSPEPVSTASAVTGSVDLGSVSSPTDEPSATPVATQPAAKTSSADRLTTYIALAIGGAVVLGAGGAAGLYLTRHRHEH